MSGLSGVVLPAALTEKLSFLGNSGFQFGEPFRNISSADVGIRFIICLLAVCLMASAMFKNSDEMTKKFEPNGVTAFAVSVIFFFALSSMTKTSEFLYFNF